MSDFHAALERARKFGIIGWALIIVACLALIAGKWQILPLGAGIVLMIQADHDRNHHRDRWSAGWDIEGAGFVLAVLGALAFRFL